MSDEKMTESDYMWNLMQLDRVQLGEYLQIEDNSIVSFLGRNYCRDIESDKFDENWIRLKTVLDKMKNYPDADVALELIEKSKRGLERLQSVYKTQGCIEYLSA